MTTNERANECPAEHCDRKSGHPGFHMERCTKTDGCRDRIGHKGACSESRYLEWGWAE